MTRIIRDGISTMKDDHDYNLNLDEAVTALKLGFNVVCEEYYDYSTEDPIEAFGQQPVTIKSYDYTLSKDEDIISEFKMYAAYAIEGEKQNTIGL